MDHDDITAEYLESLDPRTREALIALLRDGNTYLISSTDELLTVLDQIKKDRVH